MTGSEPRHWRPRWPIVCKPPCGICATSALQSMIDELTKAVALNEADLETATANLSDLEKDVGEDLSELRNLQELPSGDSDIRRRTVEIENELRSAQEDERNDRALLKMLDDAKDSPNEILATPNRLLESQPALRRLKEGLIDAS